MTFCPTPPSQMTVKPNWTIVLAHSTISALDSYISEDNTCKYQLNYGSHLLIDGLACFVLNLKHSGHIRTVPACSRG